MMTSALNTDAAAHTEPTQAEPHFWLSILVPVYQVQAFLQDCADSLLAQADEGVEVVFVDDASPDGCADILHQIQREHPRQVRVLQHTHNLGLSAARNTLLDAARGRYIWFIDSDDLLESNVLPTLKALIAQTSADLVMCDFRRFEDNRHAPQKSRHEHIASFDGPSAVLGRDLNVLISGLFKTGQFHVWSKVIRKACWPAQQYFPVGKNFEDLAVIPKLILNVQTFYHCPQVWIGYRQRKGTILSSLSAPKIEDWMHALSGYSSYLSLHAPGLQAQTLFEVAHFCARTFVRASKKMHHFKTPTARHALAHFAKVWQSASPLRYSKLISAYLARGRWLRALQFMFWMRVSQNHLKARPAAVPPQA
jgi:glycosyltransferase involved in cell wall biosynthesis